MIALDIFNSGNLFKATENLFAQLNIKLNSNTEQAFEAKTILNDFYKDRTPYTCINQVYFLGNIDDSVFENSIFNGYSFEEAKQQANNNYNGLMLFSLELSKHPSRTEISELTRAFNRISQKMPVALLLRYEHFISIAISERFLYKQEWRQGEKVGKVIILRDINTQKTHEGHRRILQDLSNHNAKNFNELHKAWLKVLNIQTLNKNFYERLVKWYELCFNDIKIDLRAASRILNKKIDDELKPQAVIRVIVRMMFIWFMKEKGLIPDTFFKKEFAKQFLKSENTYYNAILQNLFFAVLNKKIDERRFRKHNPQNRYDAESNDYGISDVFRYKDFFKDESKANEFVNQTKTIPFINGGLFQCHDYKFAGKDTVNNEKNTANNYIIDGFSDNKYETAKISDSVIFELIDLFNDYVWTIEESTPTEQDIALDPELLGTIFENLIGFYNPETKENARKQTGSFYTPREIVEYMCKESLKEALKTKFPNLHTQIDELIENSEDQLNFPDKTKMLAAITDLKILDPACGSGAFPMGMFMLMVRTIEKLQEHKTTYKNKLDIITNCIYGIDIQNIAIEISKLRFFISLLVDYQTPEHIEDFEVLPNLETKFVVANTLIDIDLKKSKNPLFEQELLSKCDELTKIFIPFTQAKTPKEKTDIKNAFSEKKQELSTLLKENNFGGDDVNKIAEWNPFNVCYCSPFFDKTIMFGLKDGFDVVIGNPPYVQLQNNSGELAKIYQNCGYETFVRTGDIYCLFYEHGFHLLKPQGKLCYITSNKWMRAGYGENTRKFLSENTNPEQLIDFAEVKVFESATVDTNILMFSKDKNRQQTQACVVKKEGVKDLSVFIRQNAVDCSFGSESWVVLSQIEQRIKSKIAAIGMPLKNWDINIYRGILTGYNEAFIINGKKKDELIAEDPNSADIIRPLLRGRDIKRYGYEFADLYLLFIPWHFPLHYDNSITGVSEKAEEAFRNQYPPIYNHLQRYKKELLSRNKAEIGIRYEWYALQRWGSNYWEDFSKQKIAWASVGETYYSLIPEGTFLLDTNYFLTTRKHINYLLSVLNSKLITYWINSEDTPIGGGGAYRHYKYNFEKLNIPKPTSQMEQQIEKLLQTKDYKTIDILVYELYGLTEEEIKIVEGK